jgi:hypothetical protein
MYQNTNQEGEDPKMQMEEGEYAQSEYGSSSNWERDEEKGRRRLASREIEIKLDGDGSRQIGSLQERRRASCAHRGLKNHLSEECKQAHTTTSISFILKALPCTSAKIENYFSSTLIISNLSFLIPHKIPPYLPIEGNQCQA